MQWGTITNNSDALQTYFYPIPFPEACVGVIINRQAVDSAHPFGAINVTAASFGIDRNASVDGINYANWFAIGY